MLPGYLSVLIVLVFIVLLMSGWQSTIAPTLALKNIMGLLLVVSILLAFPLWWTPSPHQYPITFHLAAIVVIMSATITIWTSSAYRGRAYALLTILIIAMISGSIRSLYVHDLIFGRFEVSWSAAVLCGLLCSALTSDLRMQFGILVWAGVISEAIYNWLIDAIEGTLIGSPCWWDSITLAIATAVILRCFLHVVKVILFHLKIMVRSQKEERPT